MSHDVSHDVFLYLKHTTLPDEETVNKLIEKGADPSKIEVVRTIFGVEQKETILYWYVSQYPVYAISHRVIGRMILAVEKIHGRRSVIFSEISIRIFRHLLSIPLKSTVAPVLPRFPVSQPMPYVFDHELEKVCLSLCYFYHRDSSRKSLSRSKTHSLAVALFNRAQSTKSYNTPQGVRSDLIVSHLLTKHPSILGARCPIGDVCGESSYLCYKSVLEMEGADRVQRLEGLLSFANDLTLFDMLNLFIEEEELRSLFR